MRLRSMLVIFGTVMLTGSALAQTETPTAPLLAEDGHILVIAHQGGDGLRPSNTMVAFEHAAALGVDVLEMDIHSTSDGVLVTIHDETVDRTTDGTGLVKDMTFEELQALDAGYDWPTLEGMEDVTERPYRGQGITIPALTEVFEAFGDKPMIIEIKQKEPSIAQPFCDLLHDYEMQDQVVVAAFDDDVLVEFRETCPDVATSANREEATQFYVFSRANNFERFDPAYAALHVPEYTGSLQVVTQAFVDHAHEQQIGVAVWTVNEVEQMQRMIDLGVDGIMTDFPDLALEMLERSGE